MYENERMSQPRYDYSQIPAKLRQVGRFCLFRLEPRKGAAGKMDKIPYQVNGIKASSANPAHFTDFESALAAYNIGAYDGLGLGIFAPIVANDTDDCVVNGVIDERGQDIVNVLDTYTELSPSGRGVHCIFTADGYNYDTTRYYINNHKTKVEMYHHSATNKFITLTGNRIHGCDIEERGKILPVVLENI